MLFVVTLVLAGLSFRQATRRLQLIDLAPMAVLEGGLRNNSGWALHSLRRRLSTLSPSEFQHLGRAATEGKFSSAVDLQILHGMQYVLSGPSIQNDPAAVQSMEQSIDSLLARSCHIWLAAQRNAVATTHETGEARAGESPVRLRLDLSASVYSRQEWCFEVNQVFVDGVPVAWSLAQIEPTTSYHPQVGFIYQPVGHRIVRGAARLILEDRPALPKNATIRVEATLIRSSAALGAARDAQLDPSDRSIVSTIGSPAWPGGTRSSKQILELTIGADASTGLFQAAPQEARKRVP